MNEITYIIINRDDDDNDNDDVDDDDGTLIKGWDFI